MRNQGRIMIKKKIAVAIGILFSGTSFAEDAAVQPNIANTVVVTANRFERADTETTYASEIHTREMIEASGASSLYDYLSQHTSITVLPNFGNKATPAISMRGYGVDGFQNIAISLDGQRLNNVDLSPQWIGTIPIGDIDRIEITKGSGSIIYGDGAMAGSIQIYTKPKTGVTVNASTGNFGMRTGYISGGITEQYFDLSFSAADDSHDGFSKRDTTGKRDTFSSTAQDLKLAIKPADNLRLNLEGRSSRTDIRYNNPLTQAQFKDDPRQNGGGEYTHQGFDSDLWKAGFELNITPKLKLSSQHTQEDKLSAFWTFNSIFNYDYRSDDIALSYEDDALSVIGGIQTFDGDRTSSTNKTTKDNSATFLQTEYRWDAWTLSAGARREKVEYRYKPNSGNTLEDSEHLNAWDVGVNYRLNQAISLFSNINHAYQAPDIDRFFLFGGAFNQFIDPAKSETINVGVNYITKKNRFKATIFHSDLHDEIYFNPSTFANTNIDRSHKYGLELQDFINFTDKLSGSVIYTFTRAIIDREADGNGAFDNKNLPGVSKHGVVLNLQYKILENTNLNLSQVWRSSTYAAEDFANNLSQKQNDYAVTNLGVNYRHKNIQLTATVSNIFEHKNAIQVRDDAIYPVDFSRTFRFGVQADF